MHKYQNLCKGAIVICIWNGFSALGTVYNSDGSASNVQFTHDSLAHDGDTITMPAGTFTWATKVSFTKAITLQGTGTGSTIVRDNVQTPNQFLYWDLRSTSNGAARLTGITFQDGGRTQMAVSPNGAFKVDGLNTNGTTFRWDHCSWTNINGYPVFDTVIGVADHNNVICAKTNGWLEFYGTHWDGDTSGFGDKSWNAPSNWGSDRFFFVEDNVMTNAPNQGQGGVSDAFGGARFVIRHNEIHDLIIGNHGTESTGRTRGGRAIEAYNNTYLMSGFNKYVGGIRSGVVLFHNNTISGMGGWAGLTQFTMVNLRNLHDFPPWGGADGANQWDANAPTVFFSGMAASVAGKTVTFSGNPNWTNNQWSGYVLRRLSGGSGETFAEVDSNTANTITYKGSGGFGADMVVTAGNSLEVRRVDFSLDQPGRSGGSLITGSPPVLPPGFNDQITDPCYAWNNTVLDNGGHFHLVPTDGIKNNGVYFDDAPMPGYTPFIYPHPLVTNGPIPSPTPSATVTPSPTATPTPAPSPTSPPSPTPLPSLTPTVTPTPTATSTPTPKHTPRPHPSHAPD